MAKWVPKFCSQVQIVILFPGYSKVDSRMKRTISSSVFQVQSVPGSMLPGGFNLDLSVMKWDHGKYVGEVHGWLDHYKQWSGLWTWSDPWNSCGLKGETLLDCAFAH